MLICGWQHEDVHRLLHRLATEAGAEIIFGAKVASVTPGEPRPSITLASGETYEGDIVIGADGPNSSVREVVLGDDNEAGNMSGFSVFGAVVPGELMTGDPQLEEWITNDEVRSCRAVLVDFY